MAININFFIPKNVFKEGERSAWGVAENKAYIFPKFLWMPFDQYKDFIKETIIDNRNTKDIKLNVTKAILFQSQIK